MTDDQDDTPDFGLLARAMRRTVERSAQEKRKPQGMVERCIGRDTWAIQLSPAPIEHTGKEFTDAEES